MYTQKGFDSINTIECVRSIAISFETVACQQCEPKQAHNATHLVFMMSVYFYLYSSNPFQSNEGPFRMHWLQFRKLPLKCIVVKLLLAWLQRTAFYYNFFTPNTHFMFCHL